MLVERLGQTVTFRCQTNIGAGYGIESIPEQLLSEDRKVVVDLTGVPTLQSADLSLLVEVHRICKMAGREFILTNPCETIRKVLAITRLDRLFVIDK